MSKIIAENTALVLVAIMTVVGGAYLLFMLSSSLAVPTLA